MSLVEWLAHPAGRMLTLTLLHFLWQGLFVALSLVLLVRLCGVSRPRARYACSLAALLAMAVFPIATLAWISLAQDRASFSQLFESTNSSNLALDIATSVNASFVAISPRWFESVQPYALAAWLGGVIFFGSRLVAGAIGIAQLRRSRLPIPTELAARVERLGARLQMEALPLVFLSRHVTEAMALGLIRRLVLIPAAWATEMPLEMLEAVIAHELAHLRRMDLWANFLQRIVETLFFYHPAVWWLSRRLGIERELCSDELAVAATGERLIYAQTLEHIASERQADIRPALAAYLRGESNMRLLQRIRNVLAPSSSHCRHWPAGLMALGLAICLWTLSLTLLNPLTPAAHADEPAQDETTSGEPSNGETSNEKPSDDEPTQADASDVEATGAESIEVDVSFENEDQSKESANKDLATDEQVSDLQEVIKRKVAEALKKALLETDELTKKKLEKARLKSAEKLDKSRLRHEQLMVERKKALLQDAEKLAKAGLHAKQIEAEALKKALLQHGQIEAEALEKVLRLHAEKVDKAQLHNEQLEAEVLKKALLHHAKAVEAGLEGEQLEAEALKKALHQRAEKFHKAHLQEELDKARLHHILLETQPPLDKALLQRANDERIEKLTAMVKELASQVERLQDELNALRGDAGQSRDKEVKPK